MTRRTALFVLGALVAPWKLPAVAEQAEARLAAIVQVYEAPD